MSASSNSVGTLYANHQSWLVSWLRQRTGCSAQAADYAQDTFVKVLLAEHKQPVVATLQEPRHFLVAIARRVMIDGFRRQAVERAYLQVLAEQPEQFAVPPEQRIEVLETLQALDRMLDGLGNKAKAAFLYAQLQGLSYPQIAERLGVSVSSVTKYMARATEHCLLFALEQSL